MSKIKSLADLGIIKSIDEIGQSAEKALAEISKKAPTVTAKEVALREQKLKALNNLLSKPLDSNSTQILEQIKQGKDPAEAAAFLQNQVGLSKSRVNELISPVDVAISSRVPNKPLTSEQQINEFRSSLPSKQDLMQFDRFVQDFKEELRRTTLNDPTKLREPTAEELLAVYPKAREQLVKTHGKKLEKVGGDIEKYLEIERKGDSVESSMTQAKAAALKKGVKSFAPMDLSKQSPGEATGNLLNVLDKVTGAAPLRAAVNAALGGENVGEAASETFKGEREAVAGSEIAKKLLTKMAQQGVIPQPARVVNEAGQMEEKFPLEGPLGLVADVVLDPTNVSPVGAIKGGAKAAKITADQARKLLGNLVEAGAKTGKIVGPEDVLQRAGTMVRPNALPVDITRINNAALEAKYGSPKTNEDIIEKIQQAYPQLKDKATIEGFDFRNNKQVKDFLERNKDKIDNKVDLSGILGNASQTGFALPESRIAAFNVNNPLGTAFASAAHEAEHISDAIAKPNVASKDVDYSALLKSEQDKWKAIQDATKGHHTQKTTNYELENAADIINQLAGLTKGK